MAHRNPPTPPSTRGERLQKLLSTAGVASRRHAEELITAGRVAINGQIVRELGTRADPQRDVVSVDGERLDTTGARLTILLHKPRGVVSTMADPQGRPTVRDLVRGVPERLYPIGRLDLQTSGLLLMTNDGTLAARLIAGKQAVERVYEVKVDGRPPPHTLERLRRGIRLGPGAPIVVGVRVLRELPTKTWLEVRVRRGLWHVVRRLCEVVGLRVDKLVRVAFGPIALGALPPGAFRETTRAELEALRQAAGLIPARPQAAVPTAAAPRGRAQPARRDRRTGAPRSRARGRNGRPG